MIITDEITEGSILVRMQLEREAMTTFPIPESVACYPLQSITVKDEHGNTVSGYSYTVYAEYVETFPAVFSNWTIELLFRKEQHT